MKCVGMQDFDFAQIWSKCLPQKFARHPPRSYGTEFKWKFNNQIKSSLYLLNTLSGVMSERCPSPRLCAKAHTIKVATVASRWQGDLIGSGFESHTSRTRSERLITCAIWPVNLIIAFHIQTSRDLNNGEPPWTSK